MKKWAVALGTTVMVSTPFAVYADAVEETTPVSQEDGSEQGEAQPEVITQLSLEDAINRVLENDKNFTVLEYRLEALKSQTLSVIDDQADLKRDLRELERDLKDLKKDKGSPGNFQERLQTMNAIEDLEDALIAIEQQITQMQSTEVQQEIQQENLVEGVKLTVTSNYVGLLSTQKQIEMKEREIAYAKADVKRAEQFFRLGAGAKDDIRVAKNNLINLEQQLQKQKDTYQDSLAELSFEVGIPYNPELELEAIDFAVSEIEKPADIQEIIEENFQMKLAREELRIAEYNRDEVYKDEDSTRYQKLQHDYQVKAAEENIQEVTQTLQQKIDTIYNNLETSNFDYQEAVRQLETVKEDLAVLEKRYRLGVVPKFEVEKAQIQLEQLNHNIEMLKIQNYLTQQSINSLLNGFVQ